MRGLAWLCLLGVAACGGESENLTGMYSLSFTNGENGCQFEGWEVGATATGVPIIVTQVEGDSNVTVTVQGFAALFVFAESGSAQFNGSVDGSNLEATIVGTKPHEAEDCSWKVNAAIDATLSGDTLTGTIRYSEVANGPGCGDRNECRSVQNFNGTRPPSAP
jgi:hypothetical protein